MSGETDLLTDRRIGRGGGGGEREEGIKRRGECLSPPDVSNKIITVNTEREGGCCKTLNQISGSHCCYSASIWPQQNTETTNMTRV